MKSFLDKLKMVAPVFLMVIPGVQPFIPLIVQGMILAEQSGKPGVQKKAIAREAIAIGIDAMNQAMANSVDKAEALEAYDKTVDAVIAATKLAHNIPVKPTA